MATLLPSSGVLASVATLALAAVLALLASGAAALPASLLRDVRRAEQLRASAPGPLASSSAAGPVASAPAPVHGPSRAARAAPSALDAAAAEAAAAAAGRPKRDLGVDPEELLALLALWQQQQQLPQHAPLDTVLSAPLGAPLGAPLAAPLYSRHSSRLPGYELNDADDWELSMDNNDIDSEDDGPVGAWLEAPPYAQSRPPPIFGGPRHSAFLLPALPPPPPVAPAGSVGVSANRETGWAGLPKEKRFMVSRKRQVNPPSSEGSMRYLSRLLAPPPRNPGIPIVRRVLL